MLLEEVHFQPWINGVYYFFGGHFSQPWWQNRYHQVPTFGWDTIRKFSNNALEMKNSLPATLKICFRYVAQYHEARYSLSCWSHLVCPCCFWRPTMWARWQGCVRPLIWACDMAWPCQVATSQSRCFMGWTNQPQGLGALFATSNQLHAINMIPVNYHQKRPQEDVAMLLLQQKRRLQTQTPTKPSSQQNLGQLIHSVSWHTSFMLLAIMYMQFRHLEHQMGLPHRQYISLAISCHGILISINQGELEHRQLKWFYLCVHKGQFTHGITKQQHHEQILSWLHELAP